MLIGCSVAVGVGGIVGVGVEVGVEVVVAVVVGLAVPVGKFGVPDTPLWLTAVWVLLFVLGLQATAKITRSSNKYQYFWFRVFFFIKFTINQ
jgi:hypothetical protein